MAEEDAAKKEEKTWSHNRLPYCTRLYTFVFWSLGYLMALFTLHYNPCVCEGNQFA